MLSVISVIVVACLSNRAARKQIKVANSDKRDVGVKVLLRINQHFSGACKVLKQNEGGFVNFPLATMSVLDISNDLLISHLTAEEYGLVLKVENQIQDLKILGQPSQVITDDFTNVREQCLENIKALLDRIKMRKKMDFTA